VVVPQIGAEPSKPRGGQIGQAGDDSILARSHHLQLTGAQQAAETETLSPPDPTADSAPSWNSTVNFDPR